MNEFQVSSWVLIIYMMMMMMMMQRNPQVPEEYGTSDKEAAIPEAGP